MTSPKSIWTDDSLETPFAAALKFRVKYWKKHKCFHALLPRWEVSCFFHQKALKRVCIYSFC